MNIILIGIGGTGKTTAGQRVAFKMGRDFFDTDFLIEQELGMPISEIVQKHGWDLFRDMESKIVESIAKRKDVVGATGGGVILRPSNVEALSKTGRLFLLTAPFDVLVSRLMQSSDRPLLANKETLTSDLYKLIKERDSAYKKTAQETINTKGKNVEQVSNLIIERFKTYEN